jgi:hypothetical protein
MMAHFYLFGNQELSISTSRVTMLEAGTPFGIVGRVMVVGTKPDVKVYPLSEIQWFWIEED